MRRPAHQGGEPVLAQQRSVDEQDFQPVVQPVAADLDYARRLVDVLVDRQASDVVLLDLSQLAAFADCFVIGTVDNIRQARAVIDAVIEAATAEGHHVRPEGSPDEGWILADAGNGVFVHLFSLEARVYYDLEGLWHKAQEIVRIQ